MTSLFTITGKMVFPALFLFDLAVGSTHVSNFTSLDSSASVTGIWRNQSAGLNTSVPISLSITGGSIVPIGINHGTSIIDNSCSWSDNPSTQANYFEPNFSGDRINVQVESNSTATITVNFGAYIIDPTILVQNLATATTISIANPCTRTGGSSNFGGNLISSIANNGGGDPFFQNISVGSVAIRGPYQRLVFSITNDNMITGVPINVGVCFASLHDPTNEQGAKPSLSYYRIAEDGYVDWQRAGAMQLLEFNQGNGSWILLNGVDPETASFWKVNFAASNRQFFRGRYELSDSYQNILKAMQLNLTSVDLKEFDDSSVVAWLPGRPFVHNRMIYQNGVAVYRADTIFGTKTLQARALILNGSVERWVFALSGVAIN